MKKHDSENNDVQKNRASCPESTASESYKKDSDAVSQNHTGIHIEGSVIIVTNQPKEPSKKKSLLLELKDILGIIFSNGDKTEITEKIHDLAEKLKEE